MNISELQEKAHAMAKEKGWYDNGPRPIPELLCLIHSEVSEALEAYRDGMPATVIDCDSGKPEGIPAELADVVIRIADMCGAYGIDLEAAIIRKMDYNATRPHRHGGKAA